MTTNEENKITEDNSTKNILSKTISNFKIKDRNTDLLSRLTHFDGFYNKHFNLTTYSKMREASRSRSKSPERIYLPNHKKGNGIPNDIIPRIKYIKSIVKNSHFQDYFFECPKKKKSTLDETVNYICNYKGKHGELDIYLMIFYYISQTIKYDIHGYDLKHNTKFEQSPENVFKRGNALSLGYVNFFEYFCKKKNLKFRRIEGFTRLLPKDGLNQYNHYWESVFIKGEWYFLDPLFGAGGPIEINAEMQKNDIDYFNPYYFLIFPEYLIMTHKPKEDIWQKTSKIITDKQFFKKKLIDFGKFYHSYYQYDIQILSHTFPFIKITGKSLIIKIKVDDAVIQTDLYNSNGKDKLGDVKYSYDDDNNIYDLEPTFPSKGDYLLVILARSNTSTDLLYSSFLEYKIKVTDDESFHRFDRYKINNYNSKINIRPQTEGSLILPKIRGKSYQQFQTKIIPDYNKIFPNKINKKICYDNDNAYIIEPRSTVLKKGNEIKFKIRIKGAFSVAVLDGRKFNYLKKIDIETYEGTFVIQTENVCICSLRSSNVYTEIYRFKVTKDNLSRSMIKSRK